MVTDLWGVDMNYYFTGVLIILMTLLAFCVKPAHAKINYLDYDYRTNIIQN